MMNPRNIAGHLLVYKAVPPASAAGSVDGTTIDRQNSNGDLAMSAILNVQSGAVTGTPDSFTHNAKLQHGDASNASDMADYTMPSGSAAAIAEQTAASKDVSLAIDLTAAKRYIRVVKVIAFVNGTSPTLPNAASLVLGGFGSAPVTKP